MPAPRPSVQRSMSSSQPPPRGPPRTRPTRSRCETLALRFSDARPAHHRARGVLGMGALARALRDRGETVMDSDFKPTVHRCRTCQRSTWHTFVSVTPFDSAYRCEVCGERRTGAVEREAHRWGERLKVLRGLRLDLRTGLCIRSTTTRGTG